MSSRDLMSFGTGGVPFADDSSVGYDQIAQIISKKLSQFRVQDIVCQPNWEDRIDVALDIALRTVTEHPSAVKLDGWDPETPSQLSELLAKPAARGARLSRQEADAQQAAFTRDREPVKYPNSYVTAERFGDMAHGVKRQTVDRWRREGRIIALPRTGRGYLYPTEQLDEGRQIPDGLPHIIEMGGNGHAVWHWLTTEHPRLGGDTPLAALKNGDDEAVDDLFESFLQGDFD